MTTAATASQATRWNIDAAHTVAHFSVRHMMITNVRGQISGASGTLELSPTAEQSHVAVTLDATTIDTREAKRDAHLKSPDFFDAEKFPKIDFKSKKVQSTGAESMKVTGDLSLHGVTHEVTLDVTLPAGELKDPWGGTRRGGSATTKLNRKDFGLIWNVALEAGGVMVGDAISVEIEFELVKA